MITTVYTIWGKFLLVNFNTEDKIYNLVGYILEKKIYHLKILGWTSGFRAIDDLPRAHWYETDFTWYM